MRPVVDMFENWVHGVATSPASDMLPANFSPRGRNTMLTNLGLGTAAFGARKGPLTGNVTPLSGSPVVLGMYQLKKIDGTKTHFLVSDNGRLDKLNTDFTTSVINASAFTSGTKFPAFATANNMAIVANGTDLKKTDGVTVWPVGMVRPAAPTATAIAGGAMTAAPWDIGLTYFNSTTGEESSLSDFTTATTAAGNLQIGISWTAPTDTQVDYVRVYVRNQTFGPNAYLAITSLTPAPNGTWLGFPVATLAATLNMSDVVFQALKLVAPTTVGNNPPAVTLQFPVFHASRLFLFDSGNAYYSNITDLVSRPESFDPNNVQPIHPSDGDVITGAVSFFGNLYIFKKFSMWVIEGTDPGSWTLTQISNKYGLGSHRTICIAGGNLYWWSNSNLGPLMMAAHPSQPTEIGKLLLAPTVSDTAINTAALRFAVAEVDEANDVILFCVPAAGSASRNTLIIPFNYRSQKFVSDGWNPMDIASFAVVEDVSSTKSVYIGGYAGQVFKWWQSTNDGVPSGSTGAGSITSSTTTTITDVTASFSTTGGGLIERYVYHIPAIGSVQRRRITANTSTQLTVSSAWDQTPLMNDTYVVGAIDWQLDTPWTKTLSAFLKKRLEFLLVEATSDVNGAVIWADVFTKDDATTPKKTLSFNVGSSAAVYDTGVYDTSVYALNALLNKRKKVGLTGRSYMVRLRQLQQDKQVVLHKTAMQVSVLGSKT